MKKILHSKDKGNASGGDKMSNSGVDKQSRIRKIKMGWISVAITAAFVAVIVLVNVVFAAVNSRYTLDLDMTGDKSFTISDQTKGYLEGIDKKVGIKIFLKEDSFESGIQSVYGNDALKSAFENSARINKNISLEYIDLNLTPNLASNYDTSKINSGYYIVFECGNKKEYLTDSSFYVFGTDPITGTYYDSNYQLVIEGDQIERAIVQNMLSVTSDVTPVAAVISGHNDLGVEYFNYLAGELGIQAENVSLITGDIPQDTKYVVIPAPTSDYSKQEIDKLEAYLQREGSGSIIFFGDASQNAMPKLDEFLAKWGIAFETGALNETDSANYISGSPDLFAVTLDSSVNSFASSLTGRPILSYKTRPMKTLFEEEGGIAVEAILNTYSTAGVVDSNGKVAETGSYPVLTQSFTSDLGGKEDEYDCVYVFASSDMFDQSVLEYYAGAINNDLLAQNIITTLADTEYETDIPSRNITSRILNISQMQAVIIGLLIFVIIVPVVVLLIGFALWFRRRRM